jgi:hypothetical protein
MLPEVLYYRLHPALLLLIGAGAMPPRVWHRMAVRRRRRTHAALLDAPTSRRGEELRVMPLHRQVSRAVVIPASSAQRRAPWAAADLCAGVELRIDEPPFVEAAW